MGRIHSIETMGTLDGPGIRMVVFFQGCKLRCQYCHNPDTWSLNTGEEVTPETIIKKAVRYKPYFESNQGGITFSGGEPLLQPEFLIECLKLCKKEGIHTTLDTSGVGIGMYDKILKYTDLVILDIKHENSKIYKQITGHSIDDYKIFKNAIIKNNNKLWIKHVVVPGLTDDIYHIKKLEEEIKSFKLSNIEKIELLPYHTLGVFKYKELGIPYKLTNIDDMDKEKLNKLKTYINLNNVI